MSFGHLGAAIWHRWTIICGVPVKDKCYADKPETIDALKVNIREAIGEVQLHSIDNVLKNWTDRVATAWPTEADIWMKLFSIINWKDCTFKEKKKFEKKKIFFWKAFSKQKGYLADPVHKQIKY